MKVCIIRNNDASKNAGIFRVIDALYSAGHECILLSRDRKNFSNEITLEHLQYKNNKIENYIISVPTQIGGGLKNFKGLVKYMNMVYKWLLKNSGNFDIIHCFDLDAGLPVMRVSKKTKSQYIYHIADFYVDSRENIPSFLKELIRKMEYKVINNSYATIVCTEARIKQIEGSHPKKLLVIHNSPSLIRDEIVKYEPKLHKPLKICYVGGLSERRFIRNAVNVVKDDKRFILELAGYGDQEEYIKNTSLNHDNIIYHGAIEYNDALKLYSNADILFAIYNPEVKNHKYSAPNKYYEAMYFGKMIIVADDTGVDKLVKKESNGLVINYNEESFKEALDYIYENHNEVIEMMKNSYYAYNDYSWEKMKGRLMDMYNNIEI